MVVCASILSQNPLIIFTSNTFEAPYSCASIISESLNDREITFIMMLTWSAEGTDYGNNFVSFVRKARRTNPLHSYVVFCNSKAEVAFFERKGIKAFFGHHNSLVDPRIYKIYNNQTKDIECIYTAVLADWKRQHLCSALNSIGFLYWSFGPETQDYYQSIRRAIPHARFMNEELGNPPHSGLSAARVCDVLNRAHVGLCLSPIEGGMHASIEYLLAGLPVVSTPSKGGRDFFFHEDFVEIAPATPEGVAAAVGKVLARAPSAEEIRSRTIALQERQIASFIGFLDNVARSEGGTGYDRDQWDACYHDKLMGWEPLEEFLKRVNDPAPLTARDRTRRRLKKLKAFLRLF